MDALNLPEGVDEDQVLQEARDRLHLAIDVEKDDRQSGVDDLRFIAGDQWPQSSVDVRSPGNRPMLVCNRLQAFVHQVVNDQRKQRPQGQVNPGDAEASYETAQVMQGMVKAIWRNSKADVIVDSAFENAVSCGIGHWRVATQWAREEGFDQEIVLERIENPFSVYSDPTGVMPDYSDARWRFVTELMSKDDFKARFGVEASGLEEVGKGDNIREWFEGDRVRVAEYWRVRSSFKSIHLMSDGATVEGDLTDEIRARLKAAGIMVKQSRRYDAPVVESFIVTADKVLSYSPWAGQFIPIVTVTGSEINIEGKRRHYSLIRFAKDAQRLYNYWASTEAELLSMQPKQPWIGTRKQLEGEEDQWAKANVMDVPVLYYTGDPSAQGPPGKNPPPDFPAAIAQAKAGAVEDMKAIMGIYDASLGQRSNETSGVAIRQREKQGDNAVFHFMDNLARAIEQSVRIIVDMIPKVYSGPRVVQIVNVQDEAESVTVNQLFADKTGKETIHNLAVGKYQTTVSVGPSYETQRQETVAAMLELYGVVPEAAKLTADILVGTMDWSESKRISKRMETLLPPEIVEMEKGDAIPPQIKAQMQQMQQQAQQLQQALDAAMGEISKQTKAVERAEADKQRAQVQLQEQIVQLQEKLVGLRQKQLEVMAGNALPRELYGQPMGGQPIIVTPNAGDVLPRPKRPKRRVTTRRMEDGSIMGEIVEEEEPEERGQKPMMQ